jgi:hypothetical protein
MYASLSQTTSPILTSEYVPTGTDEDEARQIALMGGGELVDDATADADFQSLIGRI